MAQSIPGPPVAEGPPVATEAPEPSPEPGKRRKLLYLTLPGCWGALIFGCLSFTPSLLPRGGIVQGLVFGITAAIGYGLGVLAAWVWRAFADRDPRRPQRRSWLIFFITAAVLYVVSFGLGQYWQYEIRNLMGVTEYNIPLVVASPFIAAAVFRDAGSPEIQPIYQDGRIVRFANDATTGIPPEGKPWEGSRILYMQHPSDPIVWWSPHLIFSEPDWISEPPGQDVLKTMFWMPFITFWQVTADLPFSTGVPDGHGHRYSAEYVDGWNAIMQPAGITSQDLASLRKIISEVR